MTSAFRFVWIVPLLLGLAGRADRLTGRITRVEDGDTLHLETGEGRTRVVRLLGVDCPEGDQPYATESKALVEKLALQKEVVAQVRTIDRYGRAVARVVLPDESDLALALIEEGLAWQRDAEGAPNEVYRGAQLVASTERLGLWQDPAPVPPWKWRPAPGQKAPVLPEVLAGTVVAVADGDTFTLRTDQGDEHDVRIDGIDCPERLQAFAEAATAFTTQRCLDKAVTLAVRGRDSYGRVLARVSLPDGSDLGLALVEAGLAWHQPSLAPKDAILAGAQEAAGREKRGLWQDDHPRPPWMK